ncbi:hypothetical protein [Chromobacterium subtsugae]|uniref:hypothetical protein n=1 Tax=Chromobacterium subtsugae TaxID=251747 RepID=UPI000A5935E9|nr:hypothetical protein [Chromobacterium subtsugae]
MEITVPVWFDQAAFISFFMIPVNVLLFIVNSDLWESVKSGRPFSFLRLLLSGDWVRQILKVLLLLLFAVFSIGIYAAFFDDSIANHNNSPYSFVVFFRILIIFPFDFLVLAQLVFLVCVIHFKRINDVASLKRVEEVVGSVDNFLYKVFVGKR